MLDGPVWVDHEGRAQGDALLLVEHPEGAGKPAAAIAELPDRQPGEVRVLAAPGELDVLVVDRAAHHHRVALGELRVQPGELGDLGGAHEGEVLRIEEDHLPLAGEALARERLEGALAVLLVMHEAGLHADDLEFRQFLTDAEHRLALLDVCWGGPFRPCDIQIGGGRPEIQSIVFDGSIGQDYTNPCSPPSGSCIT